MNQITLNSTDTFVEGIRLISRPLDTDMGVKPLTPFVLSVSAGTSNYSDLVVDLYATNSKSIPYTSELDNNWSALKPQWRFVDVDGNYIEDELTIDYDTEVVNEDGGVIGGIGTAAFYYIDDLPSDANIPTMLQCTLNTLNYYDVKYRGSDSIISFYNSEMKTIIPFQVYPIKPAFIHFSQNGAIDLHNTQWAGNNIHSYVTINGIPRSKFIDYADCAVDYPIIFNSPVSPSVSGSNILDYTIYPLLNTEMSPSASPSAEFLPFEMGSGIANGGWTSVDATSWVETSGAIMLGDVDIQYYDSNYYTTGTLGMWVSNSNANMIHKVETMYIDGANSSVIDFYDGNSMYINDNIYSTGFNVPYYDASYYSLSASVLSNIHELSGYSGIYGIAIDGDDNVWNIDFELDRIYKRDSAGTLLFTVDLQKTTGIPSPYADSEYTWYGPSSISINQTGDAYVTLFNSPSAMKISSSGTIESFFQPNAVPSTTLPASSDEGTYYRPVDIEVGSSGDVHILYSNTKKAALIHYNSAGVQVGPSWHSISGFRPVDMVYVNNGSSETIYTTNTGINSGPIGNAGGVYKYDWNGNGYDTRTVLAVGANATLITTDGTNIVFAYDNNKIGVITDTDTANQTSFLNFEITTALSGIDIIGGLSCDDSGFINILDSYQNILYRQNIYEFIATGSATPYGIKIDPDLNYVILKDSSGNIIHDPATSGESVPSLQAYGDWTGTYWRHKFANGDLPTAYGTSPKKAPYLLLTDDDSTMDVLWQLDHTATSTIEWGTTTAYGDGSQVTNEYGADHQHAYTITGLTPDTKYYYRVVGLGSGSFKTSLSTSNSVKFFAFGDTRSFPTDQNKVAKEIINSYIEDGEIQTFLLHVGDWVNVDAETDWQDQIFPTDQDHLVRLKKDIPMLGCRGNHETYNHPNSDTYYKYFPYSYEAVNTFYRSFDYGPLHVAIVDQYTDYSTGSTQYNWLEADLAASTKPHKIIVLHEPGWSAGNHPNNTDVQNYIQPLCLTYGVKIVLGGHNHYYCRCDVDGVQHLTIGGGGAPLRVPDLFNTAYPYIVTAGSIHHFIKVNINDDFMGVEVINTDSVSHNEVFDSFHSGVYIGEGTTSVTLSGSSAPFKIKSFKSDYDLRRFNDSWDMHDQIKGYVIPDYQQKFTDLWDDLIGNTVGNDGSNYQTFGRQFYEKIANFVLNHSDIDLANVSQVYSLFSSLALDYTNYDFNYPADLGHWMNILSIMFERLRGEQFQCNRNFKPSRYETIEDCEVCGQVHATNMGDKILNPVMVEGEAVVIRDTYLMRNAFDVFYPPLSGDYQQLSDFYGFRSPFDTNYEVFEYIPTVSPNLQSEGFINWADTHNGIAISGVSVVDWWKDGGYVDQIFTQILYDGLGMAVDYITDEEAHNHYSFNVVGENLTSATTTIVDSGLIVSEYIIPVKSSGCAPIAGFGLPFYTTSTTISGPAIDFGYPTSGIVDGLATSDLYVKIAIGDDVYYAPSYVIAPLLLPIVGSGITFKDGFVRPEYALSSSGFLVFNNNGDTVLLPVYK